MRKQRQPLLQSGCAIHPTPPGPTRSVLTVPLPLITTFCVGTERQAVEGSREHSSTPDPGTHPAREWRDLLPGFDTLYRRKAGREKGSPVYEQHSSQVPKSQSLASE